MLMVVMWHKQGKKKVCENAEAEVVTLMYPVQQNVGLCIPTKILNTNETAVHYAVIMMKRCWKIRQSCLKIRQLLTKDKIRQVTHYLLLSNLIVWRMLYIYNCAPRENNIPQYILLDDDFEVMAFPDLFPYGVGGYCSRNVHCRLPIGKYFQQCLLNVDGRFSMNIEYIFCAQDISDIQQIQSDANLAVHLSRGRTLNEQKITAGVLQDPVTLQQLIQTEQAYKFLKNV